MLERLYVDNYRCLVNFEFKPKAQQLVLGPNGGGKTTLFDVLALLRDFCALGLAAEWRFGGLTRTRWQENDTQTFELAVSRGQGRFTFRLVVDSWGFPAKRLRVVAEEVYYDGVPIFRFREGIVSLYSDELDSRPTVEYPFDWHRSALATVTEQPNNSQLWWFKRWLGSLVQIAPDPRRMDSIAEREETFILADLSNFANWYRHCGQEQKLADRELAADLAEAIEGFESLDLRDAGMGNRYLQVTLTAGEPLGPERQPQTYFFNELSDGQRVLIGLYAVLHFALGPDTTICIDEPDNFIALREVTPWLSKVLDRVEDEESNSQVLIISHHPELLNRMAFQDGLILDRPGGRHTRVRPFTDPSDTGLTPAELVVRGWES